MSKYRSDVASEGGRKTGRIEPPELNEGGPVQHHVDVDEQPTNNDANVTNPYGPYSNCKVDEKFERLRLLTCINVGP